jgi:uracil-DNA glycosylase
VSQIYAPVTDAFFENKMKPEDNMESEEADNEPSLDKMLDLSNPQVLKGLGALAEEIYQAAQKQKLLDNKQ